MVVLCSELMQRYSIESEPGKLSFTIPRVFDLYYFLFVPLFTAFAIYVLVHESHVSSAVILIRICIGIVFVRMYLQWLWNLGGKEELQFTESELRHRRILFGLVRTKVYKMAVIKDPSFVAQKRGSAMGGGGHPSGIGFAYNGKNIRTCDNITQPEAKEIVHAVLRQIPELAPIWASYTEGVPEATHFVTLILR
jgi:hypothetical protein